MSGQVLQKEWLIPEIVLWPPHTWAHVGPCTPAHAQTQNDDTRMSKSVRFTKSTHLLACGSGAWEVQGQGWHSLASDKGLTPPQLTGSWNAGRRVQKWQDIRDSLTWHQARRDDLHQASPPTGGSHTCHPPIRPIPRARSGGGATTNESTQGSWYLIISN